MILKGRRKKDESDMFEKTKDRKQLWIQEPR